MRTVLYFNDFERGGGKHGKHTSPFLRGKCWPEATDYRSLVN